MTEEKKIDAVPEKEPERQYYFIEKLKKIIKERQETLGRPLTYHVTTLAAR